ncbi:hypothetical protein EDEG_03489 [Edhazardia aedis USNM 41457]|uniref:Uncharacterized protein n=1 Tax=Edhazardia aedis (strain USNM 41457) TaxID=1003232 RepID=J9DHJ8_EDHAE|nr:hypothetical protein EDEG_03489 [Edhazardia aedis USNM 41457]|eukprot:EJW02065.1 hypothetical protein EDEG_03489 [Edhazardia aedis USNM 41457]
MLLYITLFLEISFSKINDEKNGQCDGIICYNIDDEFPLMYFFENVNEFLCNISAKIIFEEIKIGKSLITCIPNDFKDILTDLMYKNVLMYHVETMIYNLNKFIFSDTKDPGNNTAEEPQIEFISKYEFKIKLSCLDKLKVPEVFKEINYKTFLEKFESSKDNFIKFLKSVEKALDLVIKEKFYCDLVIGKIFIDNIRSYLNDESYSILRHTIGNTVAICNKHSSLYTSEKELSKFISDSIFIYEQSYKLNGKIPKILFECCSDLLIAEILANSHENNDKRYLSGKRDISIFEKNFEQYMQDFLNGRRKIQQKIVPHSTVSTFEIFKYQALIHSHGKIFFGEEWYSIKKNMSAEKPFESMYNDKAVDFSEILYLVDIKNSKIYRKLVQNVKKCFRKLKKYKFIWSKDDEEEIISEFIKSQLQNGTSVLICFRFFDISNERYIKDKKIDNKEIFFNKRLNELKKSMCIDNQNQAFNRLIKKYKVENLLACSRLIRNHFKIALQKLYPNCIIIETKEDYSHDFYLFCIDNN